MPSRVKNERSLWLQIVSTARITASKRGTRKTNGKREPGHGKRDREYVSRFSLPGYSYLSASTGSNRAARLAGYKPNPTPVSADAASAATMDQSGTRSEEHTSELQSRPHLVCRLL